MNKKTGIDYVADKYLGLNVKFKFKNIEMTGKISGVSGYLKRYEYKIEIDDDKNHCYIHLDRNSFKII